MSYANDKLYSGYLRRKMALIVSRVKVRQIVPHLPCLTENDREEVEAKRETSGNYVAMQHLLDCLKRRENWPEEFITALDECEHREMAAEIRAEYNSLKGQSSPKPPSPPAATVVQAHVHPAPSADQSLSLPESADDSSAAAATPALAAAAPPEPVAQASPPPEAPVQPESPPCPGPEAVEAAPSADIAPPPPQSPQAAVEPHQETPPPSPQTQHHRATTPPPPPPPPPPHRESPVHQEPEENSESDLLGVPDDEDVIPEEASTVDSGVSEVNDEVTPEPEVPVLQPETAAPCQPDPTVQTEPLEISPPPSPAPTQTDPAETSESFSTKMMPEKLPVQDTAPPADKVIATTPVPEEISEPIATQVTENSQHTETMDTISPPLEVSVVVMTPAGGLSGDDDDDGDNDDDDDDDDACLSKPTPLLSIQKNETLCPPASEDEPCSATTDRLEFSDPTPETEPVAQEISDPTPDTEPVAQEISDPTPDTEPVAQEISDPTPDTEPVAQEISDPTPDTEPVAQEISDPTPDTEPVAQEISDPTPDTEPVAQEISDPTPDTEPVAQEISDPTPDTEPVAQEISDPTPDTEPVAQEISDPTPDIEPVAQEFSDPTPDSEPVAQVAVAVACSDLASDPETMWASPPPCQENGVVEEPVSFPHNEPEENHYESPCQSSLGEQEVLVNVVHVMEEASIQNLDGQTSSMLYNNKNVSVHPPLERYDSQPQIVVESASSVSPASSCHSCDDQTEKVPQGEACVSEEPQAQILNGQAASALNKEPEPAPPTSAVTVSIGNAPSGENCHPSEPGAVEALLELKPQAQQDPTEQAPASGTSSNTKYFLTAAGVGACALFVVWKLKN